MFPKEITQTCYVKVMVHIKSWQLSRLYGPEFDTVSVSPVVVTAGEESGWL